MPIYFDQEELEAQRDAPHLPGQSIASKLMVAALILCCCGIVSICILFAASLWVALPPLQQQPQQPQQTAGAAVVSIDQRGMHDGRARHHAQRSVIRRLALLRRAPHGQGRGVDVESVRLMFPHWLDAGGVLLADQAVNDMALALSYLAQEDEAEDGPSAEVG
tara:strand:- start:1516 stop:2004 length:489 start_codon:yes stop_codon:yes gene_type:complete